VANPSRNKRTQGFRLKKADLDISLFLFWGLAFADVLEDTHGIGFFGLGLFISFYATGLI
jgi:hypothetical protein